jgi:DNA repair exonuclease SbcCD ATPase subunit
MGTGLKLALSKYVPQGLGFILLDEPTSELNQEHAAMFTGAIKATGIQVVMVSHREADELEADNVVCL